jgi:hypothetical protein
VAWVTRLGGRRSRDPGCHASVIWLESHLAVVREEEGRMLAGARGEGDREKRVRGTGGGGFVSVGGREVANAVKTISGGNLKIRR